MGVIRRSKISFKSLCQGIKSCRKQWPKSLIRSLVSLILGKWPIKILQNVIFWRTSHHLGTKCEKTELLKLLVNVHYFSSKHILLELNLKMRVDSFGQFKQQQNVRFSIKLRILTNQIICGNFQIILQTVNSLKRYQYQYWIHRKTSSKSYLGTWRWHASRGHSENKWWIDNTYNWKCHSRAWGCLWTSTTERVWCTSSGFQGKLNHMDYRPSGFPQSRVLIGC